MGMGMGMMKIKAQQRAIDKKTSNSRVAVLVLYLHYLISYKLYQHGNILSNF